MSDPASRVFSILLVVGAALLTASIVFLSTRPVMGQVLSPGLSTLLFLASIALLISLPSMYARQSTASGTLGLVGFVLLQAGMVFLAAYAAVPLLFPSLNAAPGESPLAFILGIALFVGLLLTGIAVMQAGVFPKGAGILILVATAGFFFSFFIAEFLPAITGQISSGLFSVALGAAFAWIGVFLWAR
ncbi:MAG TPA: hypothetical protein VFI11_01310 [Anaerolineales bacterium]|nr:hypothetical protein [Anaerolineales bacterium]